MKDMTVFEEKNIRRIRDEKKGKRYFSVIDIVGILIEQEDYKKTKSYRSTLKGRLQKEGSEVVTNCDQLKMVASDGRYYNTEF